MAKATAAPNKLVMIVGLRMDLLQPSSPARGRMRNIAFDVRPMRCEVVRARLLERQNRQATASRFARGTKRSEDVYRSEYPKLESAAVGRLSGGAALGGWVTNWVEGGRSLPA
jgi:hypothetical protein